MKLIQVCTALLATGLLGAQDRLNTLTPSETADGWKLLFDGKSLTGWEPHTTSAAPATGDWIVKDEAISCPGTNSRLAFN